jgi:very-short-patch-repair endonuclease
VRLARIAGRQHGVVTHRQLAAVGISGSALRSRVEAGRLVRLYRGVFGVGHVQRTREARWIAAVMGCGKGAVLSHFDAAALWQIYENCGPYVHVTATGHAGRKLPRIHAHRCRRLDPTDITVKDAIPVTTVARTLIDLTDLLPSDRILRAIREAEYLRLLDLDTLFAAVQRADGRHNVKVLQQAIERHRPGQIVRRELEHLFLELVHQAGMREPETNVKVRTRRRTYTVDCLWGEEGVAVELDGRAAHARATAFEEDRARDAAFSAIGLRPLRFTWYRVTREGADVIAELEATLAQAGGSLDSTLAQAGGSLDAA